MSCNSISPCQALTPNAQYTMTLQEGLLGTLTNQSAASIISSLQGCAGVDLATNFSVTFPVTNPSIYNITFNYTGDGTDSASDVFNEFANALEGFLSSWSFISCTQGSTPAAAGQNAGGAQVPAAITSLTNSSTLWAIAVIGLIAIFVFSGGIGVTKSLASAA